MTTSFLMKAVLPILIAALSTPLGASRAPCKSSHAIDVPVSADRAFADLRDNRGAPAVKLARETRSPPYEDIDDDDDDDDGDEESNFDSGTTISAAEDERLQKQFDDYNHKHNLKPFLGLPQACADQYCDRYISD
jgi:hypothetical protein